MLNCTFLSLCLSLSNRHTQTPTHNEYTQTDHVPYFANIERYKLNIFSVAGVCQQPERKIVNGAKLNLWVNYSRFSSIHQHKSIEYLWSIISTTLKKNARILILRRSMDNMTSNLVNLVDMLCIASTSMGLVASQ